MSNFVNEYLSYNKYAWAPSTMKSEGYRLRSAEEYMSMEANELYAYLVDQGRAPYTIKTTFTRLSSYCDWLIDNGHMVKSNPYKEYMKRNAQIFRYSYKKKILSKSYDDAINLVRTKISCPITREHAEFLLLSGLRISESYNVYLKGDNYYVDGKGGKQRRVYCAPPEKLVCKSTLRRALKVVELTPHDLRRLFATRLVALNMDLHDVCKIMGWSNIQTAMNYLQSSNEDALADRLKEL